MQDTEIMHWDLKPENLLVNWNFKLQICDFGSAKVLKETLKSPYVVSMYYRAPELYLNYPHYDYWVDIWSFGCILAEMFTHEPIFKGFDEGD